MALPGGRRRQTNINNSNSVAKKKSMTGNDTEKVDDELMSMEQAEQVMRGILNFPHPPEASGEDGVYSRPRPQDRSEDEEDGRRVKRSRAAKKQAQERMQKMVPEITSVDDDEDGYEREDAEGEGSNPSSNHQQDEGEGNGHNGDDGLQNEDEENQEGQEEEQEEEPDWDAIAQHEPARTDVPVFLSARDRRDAADERFAAMLDECHKGLHQSVDDLLATAADIHNIQREKLDALESELKNDFVCNEEARATMQQRLEESANAAQGLFAQLLMRVSQPLFAAAAAGNANGLVGQRPSTASVGSKGLSKKKNVSSLGGRSKGTGKNNT